MNTCVKFIFVQTISIAKHWFLMQRSKPVLSQA